jgi:hypothetical protein
MQPTIGRIVVYKLTQQDADQLNRRRTSGSAIADRIKLDKWPLGAQAHIGNWENEGAELPCIIARIWPNEFGQDIPGINGQVFLDGNDTLWVTSAREGDQPGQWHWPVKV